MVSLPEIASACSYTGQCRCSWDVIALDTLALDCLKYDGSVLQLRNVGFDMALWEIFGALAHGATLVIRGRSIEETVRTVEVVIATHRASSVPSMRVSVAHEAAGQ